jgi:hypothetical protein
MATNAHGEGPVVQGPQHNLPYEPDEFSVKPILMVPFAVIATGIVAFIVTTLIFDHIFDPKENKEPSTFPAAAERNNVPLNDRLARISSTDPKAEVNAPRLEWLRTTQDVERPNGVTVTAEMTSGLPTAKGNSPEYHPEELRADRQPGLNMYGKTKTGQTVIPIDKAMDLITGGLVGSQKDAKPKSIQPEWDRPKESNGGVKSTERGSKADDHHDDHPVKK